MRSAKLKMALVSSSDDRGTQLLRELAPDIIVPGLRPYSQRGQMRSWITNQENMDYVEQLLQKHRYATIGEFHLYGADAELPIPRRIVQLADENNLILHAHSDADAVERILAQSPTVRVIWAHSGFDDPEAIALMLEKHDRLWADLAFRSDVGAGGSLSRDWKELFTAYPDRLMLGTDTYTPERMYFIPEHATAARTWLQSLPKGIAERVAWKNAYDLIMPVWRANQLSDKVRSGSKDDDESEHMEDVDHSIGKITTKATDETDSPKFDCESNEADYHWQEDGLSISLGMSSTIQISQPFSVSLIVCGPLAANARVSLDASMPTHGHGMNYAPVHTVVEQSDDVQHVEVHGLVLHMPGDWQWQVDVIQDNEKKVLTRDFSIQ
jgi:hypothetical protein